MSNARAGRTAHQRSPLRFEPPARKPSETTGIRALDAGTTAVIQSASREQATSREAAHAPLGETIRGLAREHEARTGTRVHCAITDIPSELPRIVQTAICRFAQESLDHAFERDCRRDHRISVWWDGTSLMIEIKAEGSWAPPADTDGSMVRLGLVGPWNGAGDHED